MTWMMIVVAVCAGVAAGAVLGWVGGARSGRSEAAADLAAARATIDAMERSGQERESHWREQIELVERRRADLEARIEEQAQAREQTLAADSQRALREQRERGRVLEALAPVQDRLAAMQAAITQMEQQRQSQYGSLEAQMAQARDADHRLRAATSALEAALRNTSVRGAWGEAQLRNIVESAGLVEHVDFDVQSSVSTEEGRKRPDMVLHLPGGKSLPIDAKVPFDSYIRAMEIPAGAGGEEGRRREELMTAHVKALRAHVDALAKRAYWEALDASPDFVIAFIPSESLLSAALEADPPLLDYAFGKKVALASPVTLWSVMRTVGYAWQQQVLTDQAKELFDLSRQLYDRIGALAGHAESMRSSLGKAVEAWNRFAGSLETRVLVTARRLQVLDESKVIPETRAVEQSPRLLTAPEVATGGGDDVSGGGSTS
ncbi:MAG: DNA recombination protein RmuC [Actinomyces sp.]|jgi:DNA recombination protein RmuC|nr:DNA recombination protein RmuC [Actinomyces sp.]MCI1642481.1 DNA recombination protein RmuC [Actinomyces sp.]MCI1662749.1 DNA recombination protein RmuC [Actinomyces sp.]MCI1691634.1 DNA recombination protein RmuC [Actinomyces sp.]MCI1788404.1 DNA recombination protein RmuC [Actinomyces sp.]MCI1831165.1 DNA recombination protein RmuC [Actinomyces sp.]